MKNTIKISKETREEMINSIKLFFEKERDENLGDLAASLILDFLIEEIAPEFYNQGILDAYTYLCDKAEDILGLQR